LEEEHARRPYARTAAEPGENVFADKRLDLEEEKSAEENGEGVGESGGFQYSVFSVSIAR
jgi:hypothetical protein